jgi:hypothetical protein
MGFKDYLKEDKQIDEAKEMSAEDKKLYSSLGKNTHLFDKFKKLKSANDKDSVLFNWIKAGNITLKDYKELKK